MKRVYVFDVDNTLRSTKQQRVLPQTVKLIETLRKNKDYVLVLATGRGPSKMDVLDEYRHLFDYLIMVNGAVVLKGDEIIYEDPIDDDDVKMVIEDTKERGISMGMVGFDKEAVSLFDEHIEYALKGYTSIKPLVDPEFYKENHVYQLWVFHKDQEELSKIAKSYPQFKHYFWHYGGVDLVYPRISKENAVKIVMKNYEGYELICVGDGQNDLEMIKLADHGILMGNSRWQDEASDIKKLIAPHIEEDKLFDFFEENGLL
ncbi:HAD family phosphatase [Acholeplasma equirhinis]|uniref:HAD family hydrolase n=1 Tax=Acholeplasma equirhinis TaxID=555393 RepID=UPI00197B041D|nr:HAD family hydrolase [Acholeplasma equirhinis]MBN3490699.1 HAD family phosphatase [Acholeplasma equirhinis]